MKNKEFVREKLAKYKEYKQRLKILKKEIDRNDIIEGNFAYSYDQAGGGTSNGFHSDVEEKVMELLDDEKAQEYYDKKNYIEKVDLALGGLKPVERFIIKKKFYLDCDNPEEIRGQRPDVEIYTLPEFIPSENSFFRYKKDAFERLERLIK